MSVAFFFSTIEEYSKAPSPYQKMGQQNKRLPTRNKERGRRRKQKKKKKEKKKKKK